MEHSPTGRSRSPTSPAVRRRAAKTVGQQVDNDANVTSYGYDALGRQVSASDPLHRVTTYTYDPAGNRLSLVDPKQQTTSFGYDTANQLTSISYSDGSTPAVSYAYDADGQRVAMSDGTGSTTYSYDSLHRLTQSTNGAGAQVQYGYDLKGQQTSLTYPGGSNQVTRAFDDAGRLVTITDWLSHATAYHYDPNSNNDSITYANGTLGTIGYDHADRLMSINDAKGGTSFFAQSYSRDANSLLTGDGTSSFGYDPLNRVTSAATSAYTYDAADHLTQIAVSGGNTTTLTYDIADQVQSLSVMNGQTQVSSQRYSYDTNGNRTRAVDQTNTNTTYGYDEANRLVNFNGAYTYGYYGNGRRMSKTTSGSTEAFVWDSSGSLPLVIKDGINSFVNGPDGLPLEQVTGGGAVHTYYHDQLGSTRVIADSTGTVEDTYGFDAYGNLTTTSGTVSNAFRFAGQYLENESSIYYLRARYYDSTSGQFMTVDPIESATRQRYLYTSSNPLNGVDPTGEFVSWIDVVFWFTSREAPPKHNPAASPLRLPDYSNCDAMADGDPARAACFNRVLATRIRMIQEWNTDSDAYEAGVPSRCITNSYSTLQCVTDVALPRFVQTCGRLLGGDTLPPRGTQQLGRSTAWRGQTALNCSTMNCWWLFRMR